MKINYGTSILMTREIPTQLVFSAVLGQVIVSSVEREMKQLICVRGWVVQKHVL